MYLNSLCSGETNNSSKDKSAARCEIHLCVLVSILHCGQNQRMQPTLAILTALAGFGLKQYIYKAVSFCFTLSH